MHRTTSSEVRTVGIALSNTETQAVEIAVEQDSVPSLLAIAEWHGGLQETPAGIATRLRAFINANGAATNNVAVTLDAATLFAHTIPVPTGQEEALLRKHAQWDIAQFFPDAPEGEFITDVYPLAPDDGAGWQRLLCVSVRRQLARDLQSALKQKGLVLHVLDGDQFSAEHLLVSHIAGGNAGRIFLVGLKEERIDISVLQDGHLNDYRAQDGSSAAACTTALSTCATDHGRPDRIVFYGPQATPDVLGPLQAEFLQELEVLNPFSGMRNLLDNPVASQFLAAPHRFVAAAGAALREA
jgi:Tfp pilus assembly PilM family ATPase